MSQLPNPTDGEQGDSGTTSPGLGRCSFPTWFAVHLELRQRGSAGPGLSVSPRPVQGQGQGQGQEEGVGLGCGLLPTRPEFPMGLFLQRRSHYLEDTRQLSHYEALLFCPFRESM